MAAVGLYFRWTARHQQGGRLEMEGVELGRRTRRHHISLAPWSAEVEPCGWICVWFLEAEYIRRLSGEKEGEMRLTTQVRWVNGGKPNEIPRLTMPPNGTVLQQYCSYYISGSLVFFFLTFFIGSAGPLFLCMGSRASGSVIVVDGLSCSMARGIFRDQGSNFVSLALTGRFLSTGPPGKS